MIYNALNGRFGMLVARPERKIECPTCEGMGEWDEGPLPATSPVQESPDYRQVICDDCDGEGWLWSDRTTEELRAHWRGAAA